MSLPPELLRHVSRDEVNALPIRRYEGAVHVIAAPGELAPAMDDILQETLVGFDTETRPAFRPGESYPPSLGAGRHRARGLSLPGAAPGDRRRGGAHAGRGAHRQGRRRPGR